MVRPYNSASEPAETERVRSETVWEIATVLTGSALLTLLARRLALARGLVDVPNVRSSHQLSTPRGGGIAIVLVTTAALSVLAARATLGLPCYLAMAGGGLAVALVGLFDDHCSLPSWARLVVHFAAAVWAVAWLGGLPPVRMGGYLTQPGWAGDVIAVLGITWVLNLFNFMDGIDGIAASEAVFVALAGAWLTGAAGGEVGSAALVLAAACGGFLLWNRPPAKIFMGDVGSGYVGYAIATLALAAARHSPVAVWVWLILGGVFFVDATVTLVRRLISGERVYQAHRSHAYQWLARRWRSHGRVTLAVLAVNLGWLLPCAVLASRVPAHAVTLVIVAFAPLVVLAIAIGAGRKEANLPGP
jgi:Fuc2NAc and GlcNAc transferase